eukprot:SM000116S24245  [mRNA]  locus=s116:186282:190597:- [translate_table: standard]
MWLLVFASSQNLHHTLTGKSLIARKSSEASVATKAGKVEAASDSLQVAASPDLSQVAAASDLSQVVAALNLSQDIYGGYGTKWSSLFHRLAPHVDARRRSRAGILGHSSIPQAIVACYRMRLSLSLQGSQALAIHQRAGRALAQANGFRGG